MDRARVSRSSAAALGPTPLSASDLGALSLSLDFDDRGFGGRHACPSRGGPRARSGDRRFLVDRVELQQHVVLFDPLALADENLGNLAVSLGGDLRHALRHHVAGRRQIDRGARGRNQRHLGHGNFLLEDFRLEVGQADEPDASAGSREQRDHREVKQRTPPVRIDIAIDPQRSEVARKLVGHRRGAGGARPSVARTMAQHADAGEPRTPGAAWPRKQAHRPPFSCRLNRPRPPD